MDQTGGECGKFRGEMKCTCRVMVGNREGVRPRGMPSRSWRNVEMDLRVREGKRTEVRGEFIFCMYAMHSGVRNTIS
jgi:hypothetical protein